MSTYMAKNETIDRKWYILDAAGKPMGRVAAQAAAILRGKHKVDYTPHVDCGDFVIVLNAGQAVLTGNKLTQKYYRTHSGYAGGLKETQYKKLMALRPELAMKLAIRGMLPKNGIGRKALVRAKVYAGAQHKNEAQQPQVWAGK
jgi:large subunit ribosomal protein L13